jgi:hypothetical protein
MVLLLRALEYQGVTLGAWYRVASPDSECSPAADNLQEGRGGIKAAGACNQDCCGRYGIRPRLTKLQAVFRQEFLVRYLGIVMSSSLEQLLRRSCSRGGCAEEVSNGVTHVPSENERPRFPMNIVKAFVLRAVTAIESRKHISLFVHGFTLYSTSPLNPLPHSTGT